MGIFDGIENVAAEGTSLRLYFEPGNYVVKIDRVFLHERKLGGGRLFIAETTVEKSDNPDIKPGEQRNWAQSMATPYALPRIKAFVATATGRTVTTELCNEVVGSGNILGGLVLKLECIEKTTKAGKPFTQAAWGICV